MTTDDITSTAIRPSTRVVDDRGLARAAGVLFLVALVPYLIGGLLHGPVLATDAFLARAHPEQMQVTVGLLVEFVAVVSIPLIGAFLLPLLRRVHEPFAVAYVLLRSMEALLLMIIAGKRWSLVALSETLATDADAALLQTIGDGVLAEADRLFLLYVLVFALGALVLYGLLLTARLVPPWLSIWGLGAAGWMLVGTLLVAVDAFGGTPDAAVESLIVLPLPLNELALAGWLIVKGLRHRAPG